MSEEGLQQTRKITQCIEYNKLSKSYGDPNTYILITFSLLPLKHNIYFCWQRKNKCCD